MNKEQIMQEGWQEYLDEKISYWQFLGMMHVKQIYPEDFVASQGYETDTRLSSCGEKHENNKV